MLSGKMCRELRNSFCSRVRLKRIGLSGKITTSFSAGAKPVQADFMQVDEDSVAELFYTSGTSANPKGVMLTHRNVYLHAMSVALAFNTGLESVELHTIPLFHANGWGVAHSLTLMGGTHVMVQRFETREVFRLIQQEKVQSCSLVPTMATALVNCPERPKYDISSFESRGDWRRGVIAHFGARGGGEIEVHLFFGLRADGNFADAFDLADEAVAGLGRSRSLRRTGDDGVCGAGDGNSSGGCE